MDIALWVTKCTAHDGVALCSLCSTYGGVYARASPMLVKLLVRLGVWVWPAGGFHRQQRLERKPASGRGSRDAHNTKTLLHA